MNGILDKKHTAMMLIVVFFATFMDGLDASIVNVALPEIGISFGTDTATISWISIVYMMVMAGTLVAFARIAADIGVRKVMAMGLAVFTIGSLFCGLSSSFEMLIISRIIQAIGAAMMGASGPMCCTEHLSLSKLGFGLSIVTVGASFGFAMGPAIGGFIVEFTSWHWIYLINIPIGLIMAPLMLKAIPKSSEAGGRIHLDIQGTLLLSAAIFLGTFAIETLSHSELFTYTALAATLCVVLMVVFVIVERRKDKPLLNINMFANRGFVAIFISLMLLNMSYMGVFYLLPFFGQITMGLSPLTVGLVLMVCSIVTMTFSIPIGRLSDNRGRRPFCMISGLVSALAFALFALFASDMNLWILLLLMVPMGLGWSFCGGPMASNLVEHAGDERNMASSLTNEAYYVGGAIGTAVVATLFTTFSGSSGINIADVSSSIMLDGFIPTAAICSAMAVIIIILTSLVKDNMGDRQ